MAVENLLLNFRIPNKHYAAASVSRANLACECRVGSVFLFYQQQKYNTVRIFNHFHSFPGPYLRSGMDRPIRVQMFV